MRLRIFGFKPSRFREWMDVVEEAGRYADWREKVKMGFKILWHGMRLILRPARRKLFRDRLRICRKCEVYNRTLRMCRPHPSMTHIGCGCFCPFIALSYSEENSCWADQHLPEQKIGWKTFLNSKQSS